MQEHEHFEELSALAAIGQLSPAEHRELVRHLKGCDGCRRTADDFVLILDQLPVTEPATQAGDLERLTTNSYRQRFFTRAQGEGIRFSPEATQTGKRRVFSLRSLRRLTLIAAPACALILFAAVFFLRTMPPFQVLNPRRLAAQASVAPPIPKAYDSPAHAETALLAQNYSAAKKQVNILKRELKKASQARAALLAAAGEQNQLLASVDKRKLELEHALALASAELEKLRSEKNKSTAELVAQAIQLKDLNAELQRQKNAVEQERQLSGAAKDVRELMGARNLHIIDVFDFDGQGRSRKSFGRVFYIEGKSLIFYAFDLEQKRHSKEKVSFQAWGRREDGRNSATNLGVFYVDDQAQKRWVLKVDDSEKLKAIDSVFVTVEPFGGADKPTGHKLLYAYLGSGPNHP